MGIIICLGLIAITGALIANHDNNSNVCYYQQWYKDAAKEFGEDYYYPPATHRSIMNSAGAIIRTSQHYRPVRSSTFYHTAKELTPWFVDVKAVYSGGNEKLLERTFNT